MQGNQAISNLTIRRHMRASALALGLVLLPSCAKKDVGSRDSGVTGGGSENPAGQTNPSDPAGAPNGPAGSPTSGTTAAKGEPIQMPEALATPRTHFQTRSDLTLPIAANDLQAGDKIELKQLTTDATILSNELPSGFGATEALGSPRYLVEAQDYALVTADQEGQALGYRTMVRLVPRLLLSERKLQYGANPLKLMLSTASEDREATKTIVLRDFPYFANGTATFVGHTAKQRTATFQGRASWVAGSMVRAKKVDLTIGTIGILNR